MRAGHTAWRFEHAGSPASLSSVVMRRKPWAFMLLAGVLAVLALAAVLVRPAHQKGSEVRVRIIGYRQTHGSLNLTSVVSNVSTTPFAWEGNAPVKRVRWESDHGSSCTVLRTFYTSGM